MDPNIKYDFSGWATRDNLECTDGRKVLHPAGKGESPRQSVLRPHSVRKYDRRGFFFHAFLKNLCRIIRRHDRLTSHPPAREYVGSTEKAKSHNKNTGI